MLRPWNLIKLEKTTPTPPETCKKSCTAEVFGCFRAIKMPFFFTCFKTRAPLGIWTIDILPCNMSCPCSEESPLARLWFCCSARRSQQQEQSFGGAKLIKTPCFWFSCCQLLQAGSIQGKWSEVIKLAASILAFQQPRWLGLTWLSTCLYVYCFFHVYTCI